MSFLVKAFFEILTRKSNVSLFFNRNLFLIELASRVSIQFSKFPVSRLIFISFDSCPPPLPSHNPLHHRAHRSTRSPTLPSRRACVARSIRTPRARGATFSTRTPRRTLRATERSRRRTRYVGVCLVFRKHCCPGQFSDTLPNLECIRLVCILHFSV